MGLFEQGLTALLVVPMMPVIIDSSRMSALWTPPTYELPELVAVRGSLRDASTRTYVRALHGRPRNPRTQVRLQPIRGPDERPHWTRYINL